MRRKKGNTAQGPMIEQLVKCSLLLSIIGILVDSTIDITGTESSERENFEVFRNQTGMLSWISFAF